MRMLGSTGGPRAAPAEGAARSVEKEVGEVVEVVKDHRGPNRATAKRNVPEDWSQDGSGDHDQADEGGRLQPKDVSEVQQPEHDRGEEDPNPGRFPARESSEDPTSEDQLFVDRADQCIESR